MIGHKSRQTCYPSACGIANEQHGGLTLASSPPSVGASSEGELNSPTMGVHTECGVICGNRSIDQVTSPCEGSNFNDQHYDCTIGKMDVISCKCFYSHEETVCLGSASHVFCKPFSLINLAGIQ